MEKKAILGVPWTVGSYAANKILTTVTTLVLAHLLSPSDFGLIAIALMVVNFLFWFGGLGFASTVIVRQDLDQRGQRTVLSLMLLSGLAVAVIAAGVSPLVADAFSNSRITGVLLAMSSLFVIASLTSFYDAMLQRELEFRRRFAALALQTVAYAATAIVLAVLGAGVWSLVIGQIGSYALYGGALIWLSPHPLPPGFDRTQVRSIVAAGRGYLAQGIAVFIRQNADSVTVGRAFGTAALGFYSMGYRLGDLSYWAIADPVASVTFPAFARAQKRGEQIGGSFLSVLRLVALVGCPIGVILSAAAGPFTEAVFGVRWLPMIGPLTVLGIWSAVRPIDATFLWVLNSVQRADLVAWFSVGILIPLIPGFIVASSVGHLTAIAIVVVIDTLISVVLLGVFVRRYVGVRLRDIWLAVEPIVVASPAAWAATYFVGHDLLSHPAGLSLVGAVSAGLGTYAVALVVLERRLLHDAWGQLLRVTGKGQGAADRIPTPSEQPF
jgi:PST family polysaccharide transporter